MSTELCLQYTTGEWITGHGTMLSDDGFVLQTRLQYIMEVLGLYDMDRRVEEDNCVRSAISFTDSVAESTLAVICRWRAAYYTRPNVPGTILQRQAT